MWFILAKIGIDGVNSTLATGASWLCYYKALQIGDASKVVPVDKLSVVITLALAFFSCTSRLAGSPASVSY